MIPQSLVGWGIISRDFRLGKGRCVMNDANRRKATTLLKSLGSSIGVERGDVASTDARKAIDEAIRVLGDDKASYKASDYAVAKVHARIARLIGYHSISLSDQARLAWREFENFMYTDIQKDLRGVGGLNLG